MSETWENIVTGAELKRARLERRKDYVFDKFHVDAQEAMEQQGWEYVSTYKRGDMVRMQRLKPVGDRFENKVWLMLFAMGYTDMNRDNSFVIQYDPDYPNLTKQIDVFAADDETVLVIECKTAEKPDTKKDFLNEINALKGIKEGLIRSIQAKYPQRQIKFIWAISNIVIGDQDKDRLSSAKVSLFDEESVEYYLGLAQHLGRAAKYQLLGNLFKKQTIKGMPQTVPAIKGKMGGHTYYSFSIEPERLLKIGYVLHRSDANRNMMPTYQRIVKKSRLKSVQAFVANGGYFPNSIIISFDTRKKKLRFDSKASDSDTDTQIGILYLPQQYASAYIIDGQHRLYGYSDSPYATTNTIPVVAFEDLDQKDQIRLFMEINENQKAVPKNLRNTLNADMLWLDDDFNERRRALRLKLAEALGETLGSPLYDRVLIGENTSTNTRCITMEAIDKGLRGGHFFTKFDNNVAVVEGTFDNSQGSNEYCLNLLLPFLIASFNYFKEKLPEEWNLGKEAHGILSMNTGIYGLLRIYSDVIDYLVSNKVCNPKTDGPETIVSACAAFYDSIVHFYQDIEDDLRQEIKKQYGDSGSTKHWRYFQKAIHDEYPDDFNPEGLNDWWADNSKEFNEISEYLLTAISEAVQKTMVVTLMELKGAKWRTTSLPLSIKTKYAKNVARENDERQKSGAEEIDTWYFIDLSDCAEIATSGSNWTDAFKERFTRPDSVGKKINKQMNTKWLHDMDKYIQRLSKSGTSISRSEYEYIKTIASWICPECMDGVELKEVDVATE